MTMRACEVEKESQAYEDVRPYADLGSWKERVALWEAQQRAKMDGVVEGGAADPMDKGKGKEVEEEVEEYDPLYTLDAFHYGVRLMPPNASLAPTLTTGARRT